MVMVLAAAEYKLRYADSVLGYAWSIGKPLAFFSVLYVVFGRALAFGAEVGQYPLYLLLGIVLFTYFSDATNTAMESLVVRAALLRRLAFPRLVIPIAITVTVFITFFVNLIAVAVFIIGNRITPQIEWLALIPLFVELYLLAFGVSLIVSTVYVYLRDISQIWDVLLQMLFYSAPILYPLQLLPSWAQRAVFANPLTQIMQDARALVLGSDEAPTIGIVFGHWSVRLIPITAVLLVASLGIFLFRRRQFEFAERV